MRTTGEKKRGGTPGSGFRVKWIGIRRSFSITPIPIETNRERRNRRSDTLLGISFTFEGNPRASSRRIERSDQVTDIAGFKFSREL